MTTEHTVTMTPDAYAALAARNAHRWVERADVRPFDRHDIHSSYVEHYWLPVVGPSGVWLWRRFVQWLTVEPDGLTVDLDECARMLGMHGGTGNTSTIMRTITRLVQFHVIDENGWSLSVRTVLPSLTAKQLTRLPQRLRDAHTQAPSAVPSATPTH